MTELLTIQMPNSSPRPSEQKRSAYVIFHAGEVYGRDSVRWYSPRFVGDGEKLYQEYHNIGDSVVYDSTLKILGFDEIIAIDFNNPVPAEVERIKSNCSHGILRGSNYFHSEMQWGKLADFVKSVGLPVVVLGVGVQAPLGRSFRMGAASDRVAHVLADHSVSIGVRGEKSAQMFADVGIKNVRVVGCPSMFRSLLPTWERRGWKSDILPDTPTVGVRSSITLRREIGVDYVEDVTGYLAAERRFILDAASCTDMTLFAQGELFEKYFFHGRTDLIEKEIVSPIRQGWLQGPDDPLLSIYKNSLYYSEDVQSFCQTLTEANVVTGFRVHGVLPALAMGVAAALIDYDHRTHELIETFDIPSIPLKGCTFRLAYDTAREFDYQRTSRRYLQVRAEVLNYLNENDVPRRLG